ncbi:hypothetical protein D3C76_1039780 [compost metagenome]
MAAIIPLLPPREQVRETGKFVAEHAQLRVYWAIGGSELLTACPAILDSIKLLQHFHIQGFKLCLGVSAVEWFV